MRGLIHTDDWSTDTSSMGRQFDGSLHQDLIHKSISGLDQMGVKDILITVRAGVAGRLQNVLGNGHNWGLRFSYALLSESGGIVESLTLAEEFAGSMNCCLVSDDGAFVNTELPDRMKSQHSIRGATVLVKPSSGAQSWQSEVGMCIFDSTVYEKIRTLETGDPGIHDVLGLYENEMRLRYAVLDEDDGWLNVDSP